MRNNLENPNGKLESADTVVSADYGRDNRPQLTFDHLNSKARQRTKQKKIYKKIEGKEKIKLDSELEEKMNQLDLESFVTNEFGDNLHALQFAREYIAEREIFGIPIDKEILKKRVNQELENKNEISTADKIKTFKEQLTQQGKPTTEILQTLISKFANEEAVSTWVSNWKNYLKLHQFAQTKPPNERKAIDRIIARADFTNENAFTTSLAEISNSTEISTQTKIEISQKFDGANITSVNGMDSALKKIKTQKSQIEKEIGTKSREKKSLKSDIETLKSEIEKLNPTDPKLQELEQKLKQKKEDLEQTKKEIDRLEAGKPKDISFQLRNGITTKLNTDGSRSININEANFTIKLPSHLLPFTGTKNMRSINLAFPYLALQSSNIAGDIFSPPLRNNDVPTKGNRYMGHLILNSLGIDDTRILSEQTIKQLTTDLALLTSAPTLTGRECLIELGIYNLASQSVNKMRLKKILKFIRENRDREIEFEELKEQK